MKKLKQIASFALCFLSISAHAADMPDEYMLYCKGEKATGFDWRSKDWIETQFRASDYIVIKSKENFCLDKINLQINTTKDIMHYKQSCINIRAVGEKYSPNLSSKCTEYYSDSTKNKWNDFLSCDGFGWSKGNFATEFDGWFHKSSFHSNLLKESDYKDSLVLEVGKCSRIN